ncbi:macrophage mannose receptor 1-like [Amphiura filiformis]|uniref:macrophage mannose receptor 1-like n=1 Tax=Amphiura filiformis TaxID=82378 RepID=UPI003B2283C0
MDMRGVIVLVLAVHTCSGQTTPPSPSYTCESNPNDNNCYCVLNSDTNNWFLARWNCRHYLMGELVDIVSAVDNAFIQNLLGKTSTPGAWLGVTDIKQEGTFFLISDPQVELPYTRWVNGFANDATKNCGVMNGDDAYWNVLDCSNSITSYGTLCMVQMGDPFGYNLNTGCPLNAVAYGSKCYGVYTISSTDTGQAFGNAITFCQSLTPAGNLVLPQDTAENDFVQQLARLTEFGRFWLSIERSSGNYVVYNDILTQLTYKNWEDVVAMESFSDTLGIYKFVMFTDTGLWGYDTISLSLGVICQFGNMDIAPTNKPTIAAGTDSSLCGPVTTMQTTTVHFSCQYLMS